MKNLSGTYITRGISRAILSICGAMIVACGGTDNPPSEPSRQANQAPSATAGDDRDVAPGTVVTLAGSGSDPEGGALTYAWEQTGDGPRVTLSNANSAAPFFTGPDVSSDTVLTFVLTVTDNGGLTSRDTVQITVFGPPPLLTSNHAPSAVAGDDRSTAPGTVVTLGGSGSDPEGGVLTYAWEQVGDGPRVTLNNADTATPFFTVPNVSSDTVLTLVLTVTDNNNLTSRDTVQITVWNAPYITDVKFIEGHPWERFKWSHFRLQIEFSETVIVGLGQERRPALTLEINGVDQRVLVDSRRDNTIFFNYFKDDWPDFEYYPNSVRLKADALSLNGAEIKSVQGIDANIDLSDHVFDMPERLPDTALNVALGTKKVDYLTQHARITLSMDSINEPTDFAINTWWINGSHTHDASYDGDPNVREYYLSAGHHEIKIILATDDGRAYLAEKAFTVEVDPSIYDISLHGDNIIVLDIPRIPIFRGYAYTLLRRWGWAIYTHFQDDFDFLIFIANKEVHPDETYQAAFDNTNESQMIGIVNSRHRRSADTYGFFGSGENLQGVIHFVSWEELRQADFNDTMLHEIMHNWANYIIDYGDRPISYDGHFWFASTQGMLGGFKLENLRREPQHDQPEGDAYTAGEWFEAGAPTGTQLYSPLELYLAGFIPIDEVPDIWVAPRARPLFDENDYVAHEGSSQVFIVPEWQIYTPTRFVEEFGHRQPLAGMTQTEFRAAVVLLTDDQHPATEEQLRKLGDLMTQFSAPNIIEDTSADIYEHASNFFEATGGRGRFHTDGLTASRKAVPSVPHVPPHHLLKIPIRSPDHPVGLEDITDTILHGKKPHHVQ